MIFEFLYIKEVCVIKGASQFVKSCAEVSLVRPRKVALIPVKGCAIDPYDVNPEVVAKTLHACPSATDIVCVLNTGRPSVTAQILEPLCFSLYDDYTRETVSLVDVFKGSESGRMLGGRIRVLRLDLALLEIEQLSLEVDAPSKLFPNLTTLDVTFDADSRLDRSISSLSEWRHVDTLTVRVKWSPDYRLSEVEHDLSAVKNLVNLKALTVTVEEARNFERVHLRNAVYGIAPHVRSHLSAFTLEVGGGLRDANGAYVAWDELLDEMAERLEEVLEYAFTVTRPTDTLVLMCARKQ